MRFLLFVPVFAVWLLATGCAVNPVTGKTELSIIPASQEIAIGTKNYLPYQQQQGGRYTVDPDLGRYVSEIGQRLAQVSGRPDLPYEFVVLNNDVPNAWALPGGKIAINRGLLVHLEDEAQLAAVLGHEIVHAAGKHSVQKIQQSLLLGLGVTATGLAARDHEYGPLITAGAGIGAGLWSARYGREQELEADYYGIQYMVAAGYNPQAAVELQQTFVNLSQQRGNPSWLEGLFASHPPSQERVDKNRELAQQLGRQGTRNRDGYRRAIAQIIEDKEAYAAHNQAVKSANEGDYDKALTLVDKAIKQQPEEAQFHATKGKLMLIKKQDSRAASAFSKAASLNPEYYVAHLGNGLVQKKQKRFSQARQSLLQSNALLPTQLATYHLGETALALGERQEAISYFNAVARQGGDLGKQAQAQLGKLQN